MAIALRQTAHRMIDYLPEDKMAYVISILRGIESINIPEEDPDESDLLLIKEANVDNEETTSLDHLVRELGFIADKLRAIYKIPEGDVYKEL